MPPQGVHPQAPAPQLAQALRSSPASPFQNIGCHPSNRTGGTSATSMQQAGQQHAALKQATMPAAPHPSLAALSAAHAALCAQHHHAAARARAPASHMHTGGLVIGNAERPVPFASGAMAGGGLGACVMPPVGAPGAPLAQPSFEAMARPLETHTQASLGSAFAGAAAAAGPVLHTRPPPDLAAGFAAGAMPPLASHASFARAEAGATAACHDRTVNPAAGVRFAGAGCDAQGLPPPGAGNGGGGGNCDDGARAGAPCAAAGGWIPVFLGPGEQELAASRLPVPLPPLPPSSPGFSSTGAAKAKAPKQKILTEGRSLADMRVASVRHHPGDLAMMEEHGYPIGPIAGDKGGLLSTVKAFTTSPQTHGGAHGVCFTGMREPNKERGLQRRIQCSKPSCNWAIWYELTCSGWCAYSCHWKGEHSGHSHELDEDTASVQAHRNGMYIPVELVDLATDAASTVAAATD